MNGYVVGGEDVYLLSDPASLQMYLVNPSPASAKCGATLRFNGNVSGRKADAATAVNNSRQSAAQTAGKGRTTSGLKGVGSAGNAGHARRRPAGGG